MKMHQPFVELPPTLWFEAEEVEAVKRAARIIAAAREIEDRDILGRAESALLDVLASYSQL